MKLLAVPLVLSSAAVVLAIPPHAHHPRGRGPGGNGPPGLHGNLLYWCAPHPMVPKCKTAGPILKSNTATSWAQKEATRKPVFWPCGGPPTTDLAPSNGTTSGEDATDVVPDEANFTSEATAQTQRTTETLAGPATRQEPSEGMSETSPTLSTRDGVQSQAAILAAPSESSTSATSGATAEGPPDTSQTIGYSATNETVPAKTTTGPSQAGA